jgi:gas vesicle protein
MIDEQPDSTLVVQRATRMKSLREDQQMADSYDRYEGEGGSGGFMMGLLTGTVLGAGLGMLLAPKAGAELRGAIGEQARTWSTAASEQYRHVREQAGPWVERGRDMVNQARDAVNRGVDEARGYAGATTGSGYTGGTSGGNAGMGGGTTGTGTGYGSAGPGTGGDFGRS